MMKFIIRFYILICFFSICACYSPNREKLKFPKAVDYTVVSRTPLFNKKNTSLTIDSLNNLLIIKLTLNPMRDLPFPIDMKDKDTLTQTAFNFDFYSNDKIILSDYKKYKNSLRWQIDSSETCNNLSFVSDTLYMTASNEIIYEIPYHVFHNLKQGNQTIELRICQNTFKGTGHEVLTKENKYNYCNYATKCILDARVKFDITIPTIYKSTVYGFGLQLKNDSTFSPAGMDNTLWNSSYPDIYWTLYYPTDKFYAQTDYQKSTDAYTNSDTFELYHYYMNDSLGIGVYDHDDLSRDDGLGYWTGPMDFLRREPRRRFSFGNIEWFDIKIGKAKVVN
ncbi:MAG TPA: hypothetical protein VJI69_08185 [Bacteroidia bacterium]|nr:hypothetical protein [Bacteroidia bacterium]